MHKQHQKKLTFTRERFGWSQTRETADMQPTLTIDVDTVAESKLGHELNSARFVLLRFALLPL
jgi:hypothetical protein